MTAAPSDFFRTEQTAAAIKVELFPRLSEVWGVTMLQETTTLKAPLIYLDLQAGLDSNEPAPATLQLLRQAYKSSGSRTDFNKGISTVLYDANPSALAELQAKIEQLSCYPDLVHPPVLLQEEENIGAQVEQMLDLGLPTLATLDPTQEGVVPQVLLRAVQTASPDVLMLFNPKELENAIKKAKADRIWPQVLGERLERLKAFYKQNRNTDRREEYLLDCFEEVFRSKGYYTLRFRINRPDKKQTGHYLFFSVRSEKAYLRLKEVLERYSDYQEDGVPLYGANLMSQQMSLFHEHYRYSVERLMRELLQGQLSNKTLQQVYEQHSLGTHYVLDNYRAAFEKLMRSGKVRFINPKTGQAISKLTPTSLIRYTQ